MQLIIVMQDQDRQFIRYHANSTTIANPNMQINGQSLQRNKLIIVKSYSMHSNQSPIKSFFSKNNNTNRLRHFPSQKTQVPQSRQLETIKVPIIQPISNHQLSDTTKQLRRFKNLQKEALFNKISLLERNIHCQMKYVKNRENRKYMGESKIKKIQFNNNSINFNDISSLITIKNIKHANKSTKTHFTNFKVCPPTPDPHSKFSLIQRRIIRQNHSKSICLSQSLKTKKQCTLDEYFSGWKTEEDYDF